MCPSLYAGVGTARGGARRRASARRDRGAVRRPLAGTALRRAARHVPSPSRLLPQRGPTAPDRGCRAGRRGRRGGGDLGGPARARYRGQPAAPRRRRALPADGDRLRRLQAAHRAHGRGRPGRGDGELRPRPAHDRAADRPPRATAGVDRGSRRAVTDVVITTAPADGEVELPRVLPALPLKETVVFPDSMTPLTVESPQVEEPGWDDVYRVGTAALVHKLVRVPDGTLRILVQGLARVRLVEPAQDDPYLVGAFELLPDVRHESKEVEALTRNVQGLFARVIGLVPYLPEELQLAAANVEDASALCSLVASTLRLKAEEKQRLLEEPDVEARLSETMLILNRELEVVELGTKIQSQVQSELEKGQREFYLRQQLKAIQDELGDGDPEQAEITELRERLDEITLPEDVRKAAERELGRLERLPTAAAEYGVIRTYLDWILTLPWDATTPDDLDLDRARRILDEDHFDLDKVKERIVEYLAVAKLRGDVAGSILCFVGPPGVGKTSLGQSVARTLGRKFVRISVGGVRDEAEIRGHRRTYIGAMPGTIIRALRDAESKNPVFMIEEIEKMGPDWRGVPAGAMLEVLDPAQPHAFRDHSLDLPFDLSK